MNLANSLDKEEMVNILKSIIEKETSLKMDENNNYNGEMYVDYRDELSLDSIKKISRSDQPMEIFYDQFNTDFDVYEYDELYKIIENNWDEEKYGWFDEHEDFIRDWVHDNVFFNFPYDHFLKQEVNVDILVDTGDGDYDYTLNNFASYNAIKNETINNESSILWLVNQQGYSKSQLNKAVRNREYDGSKFLNSVVTECENVTTHMNALAFFIKMTLGEFIQFIENKTSITLDTESSCGLYDLWGGAGSVLEIALDKPVTIPAKFIETHIDGARGYGVDDVYGMSNDFWRDSLIS